MRGSLEFEIHTSFIDFVCDITSHNLFDIPCIYESKLDKCFRHLLLGSLGIDLPQISQKLNSLSTRRTFEPLDPIADTDIVSYLRNEKENAILSIIEQVHKDVCIIKIVLMFIP